MRMQGLREPMPKLGDQSRTCRHFAKRPLPGLATSLACTNLDRANGDRTLRGKHVRIARRGTTMCATPVEADIACYRARGIQHQLLLQKGVGIPADHPGL